MVNRLVALASSVDIDDNDSNELGELFSTYKLYSSCQTFIVDDYTTGKYLNYLNLLSSTVYTIVQSYADINNRITKLTYTYIVYILSRFSNIKYKQVRT